MKTYVCVFVVQYYYYYFIDCTELLGYLLVLSSRGLAAARDIRKGELILRVPKDVLMTSESLMGKDQTLFSAVKRHPTLSSTQVFFKLFDVVVGAKEC